jgi:hypothetical protein
MSKFRIYLFLCLIGSLVGCNPEKVSKIEASFNLEAWRSDRGGCKGTRQAMMGTFKSNKELIKGLTINEITDLFGKPDQQVLTSRQQKYYIYFFESGNHCTDIRNDTNAQSIAIRFSALGVVTELLFQSGRPSQ